jgi:two-component system, OmpR family, phosphate regulon sensor histidine kinase PhoR
MTVATKLRLASGVVIAVLVAILAVALYVPTRLNNASNEKYGNDAIPFQGDVQALLRQKTEQKALADRYSLTLDNDIQQEYFSAVLSVNDRLNALTSYRDRLPGLNRLIVQAASRSSDVDGALLLQMDLARARDTSGVRAAQRRVDRQFARFGFTADLMLAQAKRFTDEALQEQDQTYDQLLISLSALGALGMTLALALFLVVPRRVGQLYESEQRNRREAESRAEAARALEHVSDGVILTDSEGVIQFWNPGATTATGIAEHAAIGRPLHRLLPNWGRLSLQHDGLHGGGSALVPVQLESERWLSVTSVDFGEGVVYAIRDVTEERALETMRSDFVATASHELRTPLTSISGAARTLVRHSDSLTPDRREAFLQMIVTESDRLAGIVDQILLANRIEAGQIEITSEPVDALSIARSVVDAVALHAPPRIRLRLDADNGLQAVACDPDRLRQVLRNLLDNAIKYSPRGGDVRVSLEPNGSAMRFAVHDEGIGFEPSDADAIFERFRRLDPSMTRGIGGTGLGLYICRELVERMSGRIWAESRPGAGSSFYFELPLAREAVGAG